MSLRDSAHLDQRDSPHHLWQVLEAQADDMFALYQLAQLLAEAGDLDELVHLALPQLVRVSDSPYAALFLQVGQRQRLDLVAWIGPDFEEDQPAADAPHFADGHAAEEWFRATCGLTPKGCLPLLLDVERQVPGLLLLAAPSQDGFSHHQRHLLATMARELARALRLVLARFDLQCRHQEMDQMRSDFVATVSHELRTPLARIQGYVDTLKHLQLTEEQQARFITDIGASTAQLIRLVDTILDFSQVEDGHVALAVQPTDWAVVVERAAQDLGPAAHPRLRFDVPHLRVQADPERLAQVVANLLANALKFSPPDSSVQVRARTRRTWGVVWLDVCDRGPGVPPEDQPYLFSKFFRARNVRESSFAGTGLGLYICKRLVEAQGGEIRLRSTVGRGTVVRVCLPRA